MRIASQLQKANNNTRQLQPQQPAPVCDGGFTRHLLSAPRTNAGLAPMPRRSRKQTMEPGAPSVKCLDDCS